MSGTGPIPGSKNTFEIETDRLFINLPTLSDAPTLYELNGGEHRREVNATLLWDGADSVADTEDWILKCQTKRYEDFGYHWTIRDRSGEITGTAGEAMGAIGTRPRDEPGRADVGYWLGRRYWGKGIMSEALRGLLGLCFTDLDDYKVEADVYTHNERGLRLVESVGMVQEGLIRKAHRKYDDWVDVTVWGILSEEWLEGTQ